MTSTSTEPAYDAVASLYAELFIDVLDRLPLERALLGAFAELVHDAGPVADIGCGPGHVTAHLHKLVREVFGIDVSPAMIALARDAFPHLRFDEGSMAALDLDDGVLGGILALFSTIHTPPKDVPAVFAEFWRVLAPGGHLLLGYFGGDNPEPEEIDHKVTVAYRWSPDTIMDLLGQNGFVEVARQSRTPGEGERHLQSHLLVRKPAP